MSNTDFDPTAVPDPSNIIGLSQRAAIGNVATSVEDNPDDAAQAIKIGKATGVPSSVVYGDLDHHEAQLKSQLSTNIVADNPLLQDYVNSHPLAAKVSNDDYGALDEASHAIHTFVSSLYGPNNRLPNGELPQGEELLTTPEGRGNLAAAIAKFPIEMIRGISETVQRAMAPGATEEDQIAFGAQVAMLLEGAKLPMPWAKRIRAAAPADIKLGTDRSSAEQISDFLQQAQASKDAADIQAAARTGQKLLPYLTAGKEPPAGIDPIIDQVKTEQAKMDLERLKDAGKAADASATKERAPDLFADNFVKRIAAGDIGVSSDAVMELYGDKVPTPDDNLLGGVTGIGDKLATAATTGGDVKISVADWLSKVPPEVRNQLADHVRTRPEGMTVEEGENPPPIEAYHGSPYEFDAFSTDKIGTGEGAQSYGHGLYFAEAPDVAKSYARDQGQLPESEIDYSKPPEPSLYKVHIHANKEDFLDWDKPLSSDPVGQKLLAGIPEQLRNALEDDLEEHGNSPDLSVYTGEEFHRLLERAASEGLLPAGDDKFIRSDVSRYLHEAGIPGIKYLDEQSRRGSAQIKQQETALANMSREGSKSTSEDLALIQSSLALSKERFSKQTHNFVLFNDKLVEIVEKNGEAVRTVRQAAGLNLEGPTGFTLHEGEPIGAAHVYAIHDPTGADVGHLNITEEAGGKRLYVDDTGVQGGAGAVGPKAIREMANQLFTQFPNAEEITGEHVSGAKEAAGAPSAKLTIKRPKAAPLAEPAAFGMSKARYDKYQELMAQRRQEDIEHITKKVEAEERKRLTQEWKDNSNAMRPEVEADVHALPNIAADMGLRGDLKIAEGSLTAGEKLMLPAEYVAKQGFTPDVVATHFGYQSGSAMVSSLHALKLAREASGLKPAEYVHRLVEAELERRMQAKYGNLNQNILDEAVDHVLSATEESRLHEQTLALAEQAGLEPTMTKEQLRGSARENFAAMRVGDISRDSFLADSGRAARKLEEAFLNGDPTEAFRQSQRMEYALQYAKMARALEKTQAKFEKLVKRYSPREVKGTQPDYVNFIHDMLLRGEQKIKTTRADVQSEISKSGFNTFDDFVTTKEAELRDLHVPDWMREDGFNKPVESMTVAEFNEYNDALTALAHNGRDELKIERAGDKADLDAVLDKMIGQIKSLGPPKDYRIDLPKRRGINRDTAKSAWWSMINLESMFNRLDRGDSNGVFFQYLTRTFAEASNAKAATLKEFQGKLAEIGDIPDMDKLVDNDLWFHPTTGERLVLRKRNVLGMLAYAGNKSSLAKLAGGYGLTPEQVMQFLRLNIEPEDIARMEKIGAMFNDLFDRADNMSRQVSGVGIKRLPLEPVDFGNLGQSQGWYNPIKYDPLIPGSSKKLMGPNAVEGEGYYRATTPQGYTKGRTGYVAPVELNLDIIPVRMRQMIHDLEMRPAVLQLAKVFYDNRFQNAMIHYYGKHQAAAMIPFLQDMANTANFRSMAAMEGDRAIEILRQNTISTLIGLNPSTVMKHGPTAAFNSLMEVGPVNFMREFASLFGADERTGNINWRMALDKSQELQRRLQTNFSEIITNHEQELSLRKMGWRDFMVHVGSAPVAASDFMSAVPMWLAAYKGQVAAGVDEGGAVAQANRAVRRAHGSSVLTHKPEIMRTNALGATFSSLYGFFSQFQQRTYELAWKSRDFYKDTLGSGSGDEESALRHLPSMLGLMASLMFSAAVEEIVTPYTNKDKESWGAKAASYVADVATPGLVGVRDFVRAVINARDPSAGLIGTTLKTGTDVIRDLKKGTSVVNRQNAGKFIKDAFTLGGVVTGLTNEQEGKLAEFMYNYYTGKEKPKSPWGWLVGARYGTTKEHSATFDQYTMGR